MNETRQIVTVRRPGEYEPHARTWMCWPHRPDLYGARLQAMQAGYAEVARAIGAFEPVTMIAHPDHAEQARHSLGNSASLVEIPIDDCWARDSGPTFVATGDGGLRGISWRFNAWGRKHSTWNQDDELPERLLAHEGIESRRSWLTCEGGSLTSDGEGTLIVTETSILNPNRNPGVSKSFAEAELRAMLGVEKVIWLPGDPLDLETDGHIDGMCGFVRPGVVLFETNIDPMDPHARILAENLAALRSQTDAKGRKLQIILLAEATDADATSSIFCRSYINLYLPNGGVILPAYGIPADEEARRVVAMAFPDRRVVQVDVNAIAPGGGSVHCITQEQPLCAKASAMVSIRSPRNQT
ncbi:MAG: agmatine deiminase family protein [Dongiaceae bacterium]